MLLNDQPYRILIPSQNCCLSNRNRGYAFKQFEAPISRAISFNRFCFTFKWGFLIHIVRGGDRENGTAFKLKCCVKALPNCILMITRW